MGWMFKERVPSTHHATNATCSKWVAPITQQGQVGNPDHPGILELILDWPGAETVEYCQRMCLILKRPHCIVSYEKMRRNMLCLQMDPIVLRENIKGGNLLCGVLHDKAQKLLKDKLK